MYGLGINPTKGPHKRLYSFNYEPLCDRVTTMIGLDKLHDFFPKIADVDGPRCDS
jgi:hypothetical protein